MAQVLLVGVGAETTAELDEAPPGAEALQLDLCHSEADLQIWLDRSSLEQVDAVVLGAAVDGKAAALAERLRTRDPDLALFQLDGTGRQGRGTPAEPAGSPTSQNPSTVRGAVMLAVQATRAARRLRRSDNRQAQLERTLAERDALFALVAHDIRASLGVLSGAMNELTHPSVGQLNDEQRVLLGLMRRSSGRLERLATNLSLVSRIVSGRFEVQRRDTDLVALARDATRETVQTEEATGIDVRVVAPDTPVVALVDPARVTSALTNLLSNGLRFARRELSVRVRGDADAAEIAVEDDGPGLPASGIASLFDRLELAAARHAKGQSGSGLGLAIVKAVASAHEGSARAENRAEGGARFVIALPLVRSVTGS